MEENNVVDCGWNIQIILWIQLAGYYVHMVKTTTDQAGRWKIEEELAGPEIEPPTLW